MNKKSVGALLRDRAADSRGRVELDPRTSVVVVVVVSSLVAGSLYFYSTCPRYRREPRATCRALNSDKEVRAIYAAAESARRSIRRSRAARSRPNPAGDCGSRHARARARECPYLGDREEIATIAIIREKRSRNRAALSIFARRQSSWSVVNRLTGARAAVERGALT